jgi:hypothetical protein
MSKSKVIDPQKRYEFQISNFEFQNSKINVHVFSFALMQLLYHGLRIILQRFSTWGTRTPGGTRRADKGYAKLF